MSRLRRLLAALATILLLAGIVPAATADELDDDLEDVRRRIELIAGQIDETTAARSTLAGEVKAIKAQMDELLASLEALRRDLFLVEAELAAKESVLGDIRATLDLQYQQLAAARSELTTARTAAQTWAVETYMSAGRGAPDVAFSAKAWNDVVIGVSYLERITEAGARAASQLNRLVAQEERATSGVEATEAGLVAEVTELASLQGELQVVETDLAARSAELEAVLDEQRRLLAAVDAEIAELEGEIAALEKEEDGILELIAERADDDDGRRPGQLVRPVPGAISSGFGPRFHPILGYMRMHNGVDMNCRQGDPIISAESGRVIWAATKGGFGKTVMIDHGGAMVTLYAHQSGYAVAEGNTVDAGQTIGYCGNTGLSTSAHLHFEVRIGGTPVDPAGYL